MSFATFPQIDLISNGSTIDGEVFMAVIHGIDIAARSFIADLIGKTVWLDGGELDSDIDREQIRAAIEPVTGYIVERSTQDGVLMDIALRVLVPARIINLPDTAERVIGLVPHQVSDFLAAVASVRPEEAHLVPKSGDHRGGNEFLPLAWVATSFLDIVGQVDMREHIRLGVHTTGGGQVQSKRDWIPLPDLRTGVITRTGDVLLIRIEANIHDAFLDDHGHILTGADPEPDIDVNFNGETILSINDVLAPGELTARGFHDFYMASHTIVSEWIFNETGPFTSNGNGFMLIQLSALGLDFTVSDVQMSVKVIPAEKSA